MTWTVFYQADGEMRHEIATTNFEWSAEHQREKFVAKMTNPGAQIFWTWVEPTAIKNLDDLGEENNEGLPEPVKETADRVMEPLQPFIWSDGPEGPFGYSTRTAPDSLEVPALRVRAEDVALGLCPLAHPDSRHMRQTSRWVW